MARLAQERADREAAAADLRQMRSTAAVLALMFGGPAGKAHYERVENRLLGVINGNEQEKANAEPRIPRWTKRRPKAS